MFLSFPFSEVGKIVHLQSPRIFYDFQTTVFSTPRSDTLKATETDMIKKR
jgi:hypothetical protein